MRPSCARLVYSTESLFFLLSHVVAFYFVRVSQLDLIIFRAQLSRHFDFKQLLASRSFSNQGLFLLWCLTISPRILMSRLIILYSDLSRNLWKDAEEAAANTPIAVFAHMFDEPQGQSA